MTVGREFREKMVDCYLRLTNESIRGSKVAFGMRGLKLVDAVCEDSVYDNSTRKMYRKNLTFADLWYVTEESIRRGFRTVTICDCFFQPRFKPLVRRILRGEELHIESGEKFVPQLVKHKGVGIYTTMANFDPISQANHNGRGKRTRGNIERDRDRIPVFWREAGLLRPPEVDRLPTDSPTRSPSSDSSDEIPGNLSLRSSDDY